ncbi:MAG: hypothetical protein FWG14_07585 [Peptococcaceae bacterium]|nr:hypothetical protein [Peptococcaceae bacterium]
MYNKKVIPLIIFSLAGLVLILGIIQLALFLAPQLDSISQARAQGVEEQQITDYYRTQLAPQSLSHVINILGFVLVLTAIGLVSLGVTRTQNGVYAEIDHSKFTPQDTLTGDPEDGFSPEVSSEGVSEEGSEGVPEDNPEGSEGDSV